MSTKKYKGIVVGLGKRGRGWVRNSLQNPDVELVALVEPFEKNRREVQEQHGFAAGMMFATLEEALAKVKADFLIDVTPPAEHEKVATLAFQHAVDVLQEKPLADTWVAAQRVVDLGEKLGRTHMITQNYRYRPNVVASLPVIKRVGAIKALYMAFDCDWVVPKDPANHYAYLPFPLIQDMAIHHFDLMRFLTRKNPVEVSAKTWRPDPNRHASHLIEIIFEDGLKAIHSTNSVSFARHSFWSGDLKMVGDKGIMVWDGDRVRFTQDFNNRLPDFEEINISRNIPDDMQACLTDFLNALKNKTTPPCSARDNLYSFAIVMAAVESAQKGHPVKIADLMS